MINLLKIKTGSALKAPATSLPYGPRQDKIFLLYPAAASAAILQARLAVPYPVFLYAYAVSRTLSCNRPVLESSYEACLIYELQNKNLKVEWQKAIPIEYKEIKLDCGYRLDMLVDRAIAR